MALLEIVHLNNIYTQKQIDILKACRNTDWFMLINHGAKRSGKTQLDNDIFLQELMRVRGISFVPDLTDEAFSGTQSGEAMRYCFTEYEVT